MATVLTCFEQRRKEQLEQIRCKNCGKVKPSGEDKKLALTYHHEEARKKRQKSIRVYLSGWESISFSEHRVVKKDSKCYHNLDPYWHCPDCAEDKDNSFYRFIVELNRHEPQT